MWEFKAFKREIETGNMGKVGNPHGFETGKPGTKWEKREKWEKCGSWPRPRRSLKILCLSIIAIVYYYSFHIVLPSGKSLFCHSRLRPGYGGQAVAVLE